jgi:acetyltransferase-like isoleucine patch superfamily enzyme
MSKRNVREFCAILRGKLFVARSRFLKQNIIIGPGLRIYKKFHIGGHGQIRIGRNCVIDGIKGDSKQYVTLETYNPDAIITIGDNACLCAARLSAKFSITIGDDVLIEEAGIADSDFHSIDKSRQDLVENPEECRVTIGNRVSIGARSLITKGVTILDDTAVWPGSVVTRSLPAGCTACGNPAKPFKRTE